MFNCISNLSHQLISAASNSYFSLTCARAILAKIGLCAHQIILRSDYLIFSRNKSGVHGKTNRSPECISIAGSFFVSVEGVAQTLSISVCKCVSVCALVFVCWWRRVLCTSGRVAAGQVSENVRGPRVGAIGGSLDFARANYCFLPETPAEFPLWRAHARGYYIRSYKAIARRCCSDRNVEM